MSSTSEFSRGLADAVSTPSALGSTTLPKESLSYRWVINNAKIFLQNIGQGLKSPPFSVLLPLKEDCNLVKQLSKWYLIVKSHGSYLSVFLCQENEKRYANSSKISRRQTAQVQQTKADLFHCLPVHKKSKILISNCMFTVLDSSTSRAKDTAVAATKECVIGELLEDYGIKDFMKPDEIDDYLSNDILTLQVDATLLCFTDPIETINEASKVPPDDIRKDLEVSLQNELFTDVVIECGGKEFKAHKVILASQSPVFRRMFEVEMREKRSNVVEISDITPCVMSDVLAYLYTGYPPNLIKLAKDLLNAANKYELQRLFVMSEDELMMSITIENVVEVLLHAEMHQAANLKRACLELIKYNSAEVYKSDAWKDFKSNSDEHKALVFEVLEYLGIS